MSFEFPSYLLLYTIYLLDLSSFHKKCFVTELTVNFDVVSHLHSHLTCTVYIIRVLALSLVLTGYVQSEL